MRRVHVHLWKLCMCVRMNAKAVFGPPSTYTFSFSLSSLWACRRWSVKASTASHPHWGCQSSPLVSCRHSSIRQTPKRGDRGRHRTYSNNSSNKFEEWGNTSAHRNHYIAYSNNVKEGEGACVSVCTGEERKIETDKKHLRQRGKGRRGWGSLESVPVPTEGKRLQYFLSCFSPS